MQGCLRSAWQMHFSGVSSNSRMPANWKYCLGSQQCLDTLRERPYRSCCFDLTSSSLLGSPETLSLSEQHPLGTTLSLAKESSCCRASVSLLACQEACGSMRKHVVKKDQKKNISRVKQAPSPGTASSWFCPGQREAVQACKTTSTIYIYIIIIYPYIIYPYITIYISADPGRRKGERVRAERLSNTNTNTNTALEAV